MSRALEILRGTIILLIFLSLVTWFVVWKVRRAQDPGEIIKKILITIPLILVILFSILYLGPVGPFVIVACAIPLSLMWTPHIGAALVKPLTSLYDGGTEEPQLKPYYSIAIARQKRGQYHEAVAEIQKQLARFPTDFEGQLLMAQIQADDLHDLEAAAAVIQKLITQPGHSPQHITAALYALADWQLKHGKDIEAACQTLETVLLRFPNTEFYLGAAQRIAHLTGGEAVLDQAGKQYAVPESLGSIGLFKVPVHFEPREQVPEKQAEEYVEHLREHPLDTEAREKLAMLYAESFNRLDLASDQLEQLITFPNQPMRLVTRWLNMLADCQVRCGADYETVKATLQRVIDVEPNLAAAELARNRIAKLKLEIKGKEKSQAIKLGTYEQNIGLKGRLRPDKF